MNDFQGRVWKFGDNVDTDAIVPGQYLDASYEEIAPHVLENLNPEFAAAVNAGDIIVAGKNFGCGSSREQAAYVLKRLGISCVVAESFGRIFFRNAIAVGLPVMTCRGVSESLKGGQSVLVSLSRFQIRDLETSELLQGDPLSDQMGFILENGGILEYLKGIKK